MLEGAEDAGIQNMGERALAGAVGTGGSGRGQEERCGGRRWGGGRGRSHTEDSGCRGPRGNGPGKVVTTALRLSVSPLCVWKEGGQCSAWKPEKGTDRPEAKEAGQGVAIRGRLGDRLGIKRPEESQALALGWVRSEAAEQPRWRGRLGLRWSLPASAVGALKAVSRHQPLITTCSCFTCFRALALVCLGSNDLLGEKDLVFPGSRVPAVAGD